MQREHHCLKEYLGTISKELNSYLRMRTRIIDDELEKCKIHINASLDKATAYNDSFVYRMDEPFNNIPFELFSIWFKNRINNVVEVPNFLSTTCDPQKYFLGQNILFRIKTNYNSCGKVISSIIEKCAIEGEILFKSNTKFRILGVHNKNKLIELQELATDFKPDHILVEDYYLVEPEIRQYILNRNNKDLNYIYSDEI